jgi:hypothetical protein
MPKNKRRTSHKHSNDSITPAGELETIPQTSYREIPPKVRRSSRNRMTAKS